MNHLLEVFQKIYVINLASRADRRREMEAQLQRIGLSLRSEGVELFEAVRPQDKGDFPSIGSRGCFMSHLGVLRKAAAGGLDRILIIEDDLNFVDDIERRLGAVAGRLRENDWAMFYGGYRLEEGAPVATGSTMLVVPSDQSIGTSHFIGIAGTAIEPLVSYLQAQSQRKAGDAAGGPMHVDGSYSWFRRAHPELLTLLAVPELGYQRSSRTDVHDLRWFDRTWGVRRALAILRTLRNKGA